MREFRYIDDVQKWLEPMNYEQFWDAIAPYPLVLQPREHCDKLLADGELDTSCVLYLLKDMACTELTALNGLGYKVEVPYLKLVDSH